MADKEKIKAEIQRLEKLKEESVSEDLLDEIHNRWEDLLPDTKGGNS